MNLIDISFHSPALNRPVLKLLPENLDNLRILDCGCGIGEWGFLIRTRKKGCPHIIGIDIDQEYLRVISPLKIYDQLWNMDFRDINFKDNFFDISLGFETVEHLNKKDGYIYLSEIERVTKNLVVLSTPNGPMFSRDHKSHWFERDFLRLGYKTRIIYGHIIPRSLRLADRIRRKIFGLSKGEFILAVKRKRQTKKQ